MLFRSVNLFANINMNDNKKESAVRMITDVISDGILSNFDKRFVNNNQEFKKLIADCIVANGMINNNLNIQFIPAHHIVPFVINENEEGFGESILSDALFPARLLLDLFAWRSPCCLPVRHLPWMVRSLGCCGCEDRS